ncbi:16S rRNA (uracil(1498)-N(3))-methyltransferase [Bacterioplanes sanyensis]|uniref:Ribosomal RNA small subunit methyltransferase E n=1 Tax=Bacterioplanes sanyensis TaxID=1249553 RepID=A0A222FII4_9GAMM|nr:16S rRNA (uracil(1498)-N(3))-methyltransferase [Bacterioplanes sanyensis]ASP38406.1 16S rRNA (uracil(1498)-N(3))-methyltransferase [Bacterioplanes sanyensis]
MATPRIYHPEPFSINTVITLDDNAAAHLVRVLRLQNDAPILLFDGSGQEYAAKLTDVGKKTANAYVTHCSKTETASPLQLHLGQVISKGDRMDFTIQKATELGIHDITPLWSQRCDVKLNQGRLQKKCEHWQRVAISACEQSGRCQVPTIHAPQTLSDWLAQIQADCKLVLHPHNQSPLKEQAVPESVALLVGPEGGLSDDEVALCQQRQFNGLTLGPRILRTETAALTALAVLQYQWGDF